SHFDPDGQAQKQFWIRIATGFWRQVERKIALREAAKASEHGVQIAGPRASRAARKMVKDANPGGARKIVRHSAHEGGPPSGMEQHQDHWQDLKSDGGHVNYKDVIFGVLSFLPGVGFAI